MKTKIKIKKFTVFYLVFNLIISAGMLCLNPAHTTAASLTNLSDTMSRLKKSTSSDHTIKFLTPTGAGDDTNTIRVTFPAAFNIGLVDFSDIDLSHGPATGYETEEPLADSADATHWGASFTGQILTLTHPTDGAFGDIAGSDYVVIEIGQNAAGGSNRITNPANAAIYTVSIDGTFGDTGSTKVMIIDEDQVTVDTTIDEVISFAINESAVSLTKSDGTHPDFAHTGYNIGAPLTLSASTNSVNGYIITYNGPTLTSGGSTIAGMAKNTSNTNSDQFGMNLRANITPIAGAEPLGGSGTPSADYNTVDQYRFVANTPTAIANAAGQTMTTTYTVSFIVNVATATAAGAYATTLTYICTANF